MGLACRRDEVVSRSIAAGQSLTRFGSWAYADPMWKHREMQMRNLADLSHWLLDTPQLKTEWGDDWWKLAFEACSSPADWAGFQASHGSDPRVAVLDEKFRQIDEQNQALPRSRVRQAVVLPNLED